MITFYSFCWSGIISSVFILVLCFFRKKTFFILNFGVPILLLLFTFSLVRMLIPFEFSYQKVIHDKYLYAALMYPYILAGKHQSFLLSIIIGVWIIGSCFFFYRFFRKARSLRCFLQTSYMVCLHSAPHPGGRSGPQCCLHKPHSASGYLPHQIPSCRL